MPARASNRVRRPAPWLALVAALLSVGLAGCSGSPATSAGSGEKPATVKEIPGKKVKQVTLTEQAARRLGIETVAVANAPAASPAPPPVTVAVPVAAGAQLTPAPAPPMMMVPYAAVVYSADGKAWVYTETGPLTYLREQVAVVNVTGESGEDAIVSSGPAVGTPIVTTGVMELYGAELGIGK